MNNKFTIDGNNKDNYDILHTDKSGNIKFIAEVINEDIAYILIDHLNRYACKIEGLDND